MTQINAITEQASTGLTQQSSTGERRLSAAEFQQLGAVPAAVEWFANIDNPRTRRAYQNDLEDFCGFVSLAGTEEFRCNPLSRFSLARTVGAARPLRCHDPAQIGGSSQLVRSSPGEQRSRRRQSRAWRQTASRREQ